jgi:hypothetical protein
MIQFGIHQGAPSHPASGPAAERPYVRLQGASNDTRRLGCRLFVNTMLGVRESFACFFEFLY